MTPRRRQGTGRAAFDHISQQLTDSLSELSRVTTAQAVIAETARGEIDRARAVLDRLDTDLLTAVVVAAGAVHALGKEIVVERQRVEMLRVPFAVCTCNHGAEEHPRGGHCQGVDSYGQQCSCESFERDTSDDPDEESP